LPELASTRFGLTFENPIGLAAGFDKAADASAGLFALGFGFVEVGTLTPLPQDGSPRPRLFRVPADRALVNRMGFNNPGAEAGVRNLQSAYRPAPLGINLGKNKSTPEEGAAADYESGLRTVAPVADYLAVNVSSPNTPGLRRLQEADRLMPLLEALRAANTLHRPLLLKIAPDLDEPALDELVDCALAAGVDGLIATNTTLARPGSLWGAYREAGGVSGGPLAARATECLKLVRRRSKGRLPVVAVGGLFTGDDVFERLKLGGCLVQLYTGFIYGGPAVAGRICLELAQRMRREGYRSLDELVGKADLG
jgi:dihydroorotate dehydrogenase